MKVLVTLFLSLPRLIIGVAMLAMVLINLANVTGRHVFGRAVFWSEEIMVLLLVWGVFIGAIAVTFNGKHLRMDLFSAGLKRPWAQILNAAMTVVLIGVVSYAMYHSYQAVSLIGATGSVSLAAKYPVVIKHAAILFGLILIVVAVLVRLRAYLSGKFE